MKFKNLQLDMFVSVTDEYRAIMPAMITWGKGQGKIIGFEKHELSRSIDENIPRIEWADGHKSTMHPHHLQPSTKKKYFIATLS